MSKVVVFYALRSFVLAKLLVIDNVFKERLGLNGQNVLLVPFFGAKSCWFGWEKLVFSLGFHLRLLAGSFWGIEHLPELKIAKISVFHGSGAGSVRSRSPYYWSSLGNFFGLANRPIVVGFWWFLQHWKAVFKVACECHVFRALWDSFNNGNLIFPQDSGLHAGNSTDMIRLHGKLWILKRNIQYSRLG